MTRRRRGCGPCCPNISALAAEAGCLTFDVVPTTDPLAWELNETFTDRAAYAAHQARTRASTWGIETIGLTRRFEVSEE